MSTVIVSGGFDDLRSRDLRFLEEAAKLGSVTAVIWSDATIRGSTGITPRFPLVERCYMLDAIRFVSATVVGEEPWDESSLPAGLSGDIWADLEANGARRSHCQARRMRYHLISPDALRGFPMFESVSTGRKKVVVTGCFDWLHSGHVRFFEEASSYGDLAVIVGNDANIRLLKGQGHPMQSQDERRYAVSTIRYVAQALVSSGNGWLDAEPEMKRLKPDVYVVNEDGDKGGKREYCAANGIEYVVLQRSPAPGLPLRSSTDLRGY